MFRMMRTQSKKTLMNQLMEFWKYQLESFSKPPPIILLYPLGKAIEAGKEDYLEQNSCCQFVGGSCWWYVVLVGIFPFAKIPSINTVS